MCWNSEPGKLQKKISEGKIVYKCLTPKGLFSATSEIYCYTYVWRKLNEEKELRPFLTYPDEKVYTITVGYHSWNTLIDSDFWLDNNYYEMLIPKGAVYYENEDTGEVVSSQIKMMRKIIYPNTKITILHKIGILLGFLRKYDS